MKSAIRMLVAALALGLSPVAVSAQTTAVIVPSSAGGGLDAVARIITAALRDKNGGSYIVENRGGANGEIGAKAAAAAAPDGRTWLLTDSALLTVNPYLLSRDASFDPGKALTLVTPIGYQTSVLVVNPKVYPPDFKTFVAAAKEKQIVYGSGGFGSAGHLTMAYFGHMAGLDLVHAPYRGGGPLMADLVAGQIGTGFVALSVALPHIRSGTIVPLAVAGRQRAEQLPDVPTISELGFADFQVETGFFIFLPAKASPELVAKVRAEIESVMSDPTVIERIKIAGMDPVRGEAPEKTLEWVAHEQTKWKKLIDDKVITAQ